MMDNPHSARWFVVEPLKGALDGCQMRQHLDFELFEIGSPMKWANGGAVSCRAPISWVPERSSFGTDPDAGASGNHRVPVSRAKKAARFES